MRPVQELSLAALRRRCESGKRNIDDETAELGRRGYDWFFTTVRDKRGNFRDKMIFYKGPGIKFTVEDFENLDDYLKRNLTLEEKKEIIKNIRESSEGKQ